MKTLIMLTALVLSSSLFANSRTTLKTSYTTVLLAYNIPMNQVCVDGDEMRTIEKRKVCKKYSARRGSRNNDRRVCIKTEMEHFSKPLQYEKKVCVRWQTGGNRDRQPNCTKYTTVTAHLPLNYTKTVRKHRWSGSRNDGDWGFGKVISKEVFPVAYCN